MPKSMSIQVINRDDEDLTLCVEPWATEVVVKKGKDHTVGFHGPREDVPTDTQVLEFSASERRVTLHGGWTGCYHFILEDGGLVAGDLPTNPDAA